MVSRASALRFGHVALDCIPFCSGCSARLDSGLEGTAQDAIEETFSKFDGGLRDIQAIPAEQIWLDFKDRRSGKWDICAGLGTIPERHESSPFQCELLHVCLPDVPLPKDAKNDRGRISSS